MSIRDLTLEDAMDFLRRSVDAAPTIARSFDSDEGAEVRVEVRVTVDSGASYAKMAHSSTAYVFDGKWYVDEDEALTAKWGEGSPVPA